MIKRGALLALASVAALAACKGSVDWVAKLQADPLYQRAEKLRDAPSCSKTVPMEFGRSFPVPLPGLDGKFQVLYYPTVTSPGKSEVMSPRFAGTFTRGDAAADACSALPAELGRPSSHGPAVPAGVSMKEYYRAEATLFASLDKASALYAKGGAPSAEDKKALGDFMEAFTTLAEPGLKADYYRVNPDFWEWLRREGGRSLSKP